MFGRRFMAREMEAPASQRPGTRTGIDPSHVPSWGSERRRRQNQQQVGKTSRFRLLLVKELKEENPKKPDPPTRCNSPKTDLPRGRPGPGLEVSLCPAVSNAVWTIS